MKLLLDENISRRLVAKIDDLFAGSSHVFSEGLLHVPDLVIWNYAKRHGFCILTADSDFHELAGTLGSPPKVIWLRGCDYPNAAAESLLRTQAVRIAEFLEDSDRAVLILQPGSKWRWRGASR